MLLPALLSQHHGLTELQENHSLSTTAITHYLQTGNPVPVWSLLIMTEGAALHLTESWLDGLQCIPCSSLTSAHQFPFKTVPLRNKQRKIFTSKKAESTV